jgi:menaquinone-9 beta-reductase
MGNNMTFDVTVVGAGPGGSTAAKILAEKGYKVLLLEKERFPRDKTCGGGLPARVLRRYPYIIKDDIIESYTSCGTVYSPTMRYKVEVLKDQPVIAMSLRIKLDAALAKFAVDAGATLRQETEVTTASVTAQQAQVITAKGERIESSFLIGSDGAHSTVAKSLGLRKPGTQSGVCILQEFPVTSTTLDRYFTNKRKVLIHARFKGQPGYGWVFPKKEHLNIGFAVIQPETDTWKEYNLRECYQNYLSALKEQGLIPQELPEVPVKGGATPIKPLDRTYMDRAILVGDAAGFINPLSGEGIYYAMTSGELAANTITEAIEKNQYDAQFLSRYEPRWKKAFGRDLDFINKLLLRGGMEFRDNMFFIANHDRKLTELLVGVVTGDLSIYEQRRKMMRRYIIASLKTKLGRKKIE